MGNSKDALKSERNLKDARFSIKVSLHPMDIILIINGRDENGLTLTKLEGILYRVYRLCSECSESFQSLYNHTLSLAENL